ncbi:MAG TPA: hypothetical protein VLT57_06740 [Bryobacteraceae bacterium]|nr:hypothetical protein [Bryobacteraceae bacterium]
MTNLPVAQQDALDAKYNERPFIAMTKRSALSLHSLSSILHPHTPSPSAIPQPG